MTVAGEWLATDGLQEAVLSVFEFERIVRPMVEVGGYRALELPDAPPEQHAAWRGAEGCRRIEQRLLVPVPGSAGVGCLRLVRFEGVAQRVMRSSQRSWDTGGIFDIDVYARDLEPLYRALQRHGWSALGEPVEYREAEFHVRQVLAAGPDGLMVAIIQRYSPPVENLPASLAMTPIFNSTQMVRDFRRAAHFYESVLGWHKTHEFLVEGAEEPGADVLGLPLPMARSARRRVGMLRPPQGRAEDGTIELIENESMSGRDFAEHCRAPNVGLLALRFRVPDAARYADAVRARGGVLETAPTRFELAPYGRVVLFSVRSPEGALLEFLQPA